MTPEGVLHPNSVPVQLGQLGYLLRRRPHYLHRNMQVHDDYRMLIALMAREACLFFVDAGWIQRW